jgi:hypothetical protein
MTAQRCPRGAPRQQTNVSIPETMTLQKFREISRKISIFRETSYSLITAARELTVPSQGRLCSSLAPLFSYETAIPCVTPHAAKH